MAQIDATELSVLYSAFATTHIDQSSYVNSSGSYYEWQTTAGFYATALSYDGDITYPALGGTINSVNIVDSTFNPALNITGLDVALTNLVDTSSPASMQVAFWNTVLAGNTTILTPTQGGQTFFMMGDFVSVGSGDTLHGGDDVFSGNSSQEDGTLTGDAIMVLSGAR